MADIRAPITCMLHIKYNATFLQECFGLQTCRIRFGVPGNKCKEPGHAGESSHQGEVLQTFLSQPEREAAFQSSCSAYDAEAPKLLNGSRASEEVLSLWRSNGF